MVCCFIMITQVNKKIPNSLVVAYEDNYKVYEDVSFPFPAISIVGDYVSNTSSREHVHWLEQSAVFSFFGIKSNLPKLIDFVGNNSKDLYSTLVASAVCRNMFVISLFNETYNVTHKAVEYIKKSSSIDWFKEQFSLWNHFYAPKFAELVTRRGIAFSFNMLSSEELFNSKE